MPTLTEQKEALYANMAGSLAKYSAQDADWLDTDDPRWQQARTLDDRLVATRTDDTVPLADYRKRLMAFMLLYMKQPNG